MRLTRITLPTGDGEGFVAAFPGRSDEAKRSDEEKLRLAGEPKAFLSFASAGDMKFGDPDRVADRERFLRRAGMDPSWVLGLELSHSREVLFPALGDDLSELAHGFYGAEGSGGADGIVLLDGRAASVTVADCMPIWILDRDSGAYGILHSGWRGTGILAVALRCLSQRFGSSPASIALILGPAIGPCCYAVSEERAAKFSSEFGPDCVHRRGRVFLDLRSANIALAEASDVGQVLSVEACTSCDERLGSYRRQGASFTRMLAVCGFSPCPTGILAEEST